VPWFTSSTIMDHIMLHFFIIYLYLC
jgi:hypothetical protein